MTACVVILALTLGCGTSGAVEAPTPVHVTLGRGAVGELEAFEPGARTDRWVGEDKLRHFVMSFAATTMVYGGARAAVDAETALGAAALGAVTLGVGKEVHDARAGAFFDWKDLAWDFAGVAVAVILVDRIR